MAILKIQPVNYKGKRLNEVGDRIVDVFNPLIDDYEINNKLLLLKHPLDMLMDLTRGRVSNLFLPIEINNNYFAEYLSHYGQPILGITSIPAKSIRHGWLYGFADITRKSTFVSTSRFEYDLDSDSHIKRIIITSLHELGHVFGLEHHIGDVFTLNGRYCPMTVYNTNFKDTSTFCTECSDRLLEFKW